jgi:hypothetical protein
MARIFDFDGHPWSEKGRQGFRLRDPVEDLTPDDVLRLTDGASGDLSYWKADQVERTAKGWCGVLAQTEWPGGAS